MIYAVIDTNVLIAALLSRHADSATVKVVGKISETAIRPLYLDCYDNTVEKTKLRTC